MKHKYIHMKDNNTIFLIPSPKDGGDVVCHCPMWPASYARWNKNAQDIVMHNNMYPKLLKSLKIAFKYMPRWVPEKELKQYNKKYAFIKTVIAKCEAYDAQHP